MATEKRYFPRVTVSLEGHIQNGTVKVGFVTIDLTVHGVSFTLDQGIPVGERVQIVLYGNEDSIQKHELEATVVRCNPSKSISSPKFIVAVKFINPDDRYLMDSLSLIHGGK